MKNPIPNECSFLNAGHVWLELEGIDDVLDAWTLTASVPESPLTPAGALRLATGAQAHVAAVLDAAGCSASVTEFVYKLGLPAAVGLQLASFDFDELTDWVDEHCCTVADLAFKMLIGEPFEPVTVHGQVALYLSARSARGQRLGEAPDGVDAVVARGVSPTVGRFLESLNPGGAILDVDLALVQPGGLMNPAKWGARRKR